MTLEHIGIAMIAIPVLLGAMAFVACFVILLVEMWTHERGLFILFVLAIAGIMVAGVLMGRK